MNWITSSRKRGTPIDSSARIRLFQGVVAITTRAASPERKLFSASAQARAGSPAHQVISAKVAENGSTSAARERTEAKGKRAAAMAANRSAAYPAKARCWRAGVVETAIRNTNNTPNFAPASRACTHLGPRLQRSTTTWCKSGAPSREETADDGTRDVNQDQTG